MQKARRHPEGLRPLVSVWFQGLFHSPSWGSFHLSLTVLVHYRSLSSIQSYQMVLANSDRISPVPPYSGYPPSQQPYIYRTITLYGQPFQTILFQLLKIMQVLLPPRTKALRFGLFRFRSPLLTESLLFSLPPGTQMFQFPGFSTFVIMSST